MNQKLIRGLFDCLQSNTTLSPVISLVLLENDIIENLSVVLLNPCRYPVETPSAETPVASGISDKVIFFSYCI